MKTLYLVRHGSVYNPDGVMYRRLPGFHLSEQGRREAEETAQFLKAQPIETIYHSPLERARETAELLGQQIAAPLVVDERIHEWAEFEPSREVLDRMAAFLNWWRQSRESVAA